MMPKKPKSTVQIKLPERPLSELLKKWEADKSDCKALAKGYRESRLLYTQYISYARQLENCSLELKRALGYPILEDTGDLDVHSSFYRRG